MPSGDTTELTHPTTTTGGVAGFLTPYDMTLKKILFRLDDINAQADITFKVERVDNDNTADEIASAEFEDEIASDTLYELNRSDFNVNPKVVANSMAALSITADADFNLSGISKAIFVTSVWEVEIIL